MLRRLEDADLPFLKALYRSLREPELALLPPDLVETFLDQQFRAQYHHYTTCYDSERYRIVELDGRPVGRLFVARWPEEYRIVDIALLPEFRGGGLGGHLLRALLREADDAGLPVSIHVERHNPALRLYRRLGFELADDGNAVYLLMRRPVGAGPAAIEP